jgi:hypothetical protein
VVEFFDEKYDWEAPVPLPAGEGRSPSGGASPDGGNAPGGDPTPPSDEPRVSHIRDIILMRDIMTLPDGDTVDRNMYRDEWARAVKTFVAEKNGAITAALDNPEQVEAIIDELNATLLNRPRFYFNEDNLQVAHRIVAGVRDFFLAAAGRQPLPAREKQLAEFKQALINKFALAGDSAQTFKRSVMVEFIADQAVSNDRFRTTINEKPSLEFLRWDEFEQAYPVTEWLAAFSKDELVELVSDISNARILKL